MVFVTSLLRALYPPRSAGVSVFSILSLRPVLPRAQCECDRIALHQGDPQCGYRTVNSAWRPLIAHFPDLRPSKQQGRPP
jgi:hypothetical protein